MNKRFLKVLLPASAIILLAAGCSSSQPQASTQTQTGAQATPASNGSGAMASSTSASTTPGRGGFRMPNLPAGEKPFFGSIASVSGSQITISGRSRNGSSTPSTIVDITGTTQFTGGAQSDLTAGTRVAGAGTVNSDNSLNAVTIQINPSFPSHGQSGNYHGGASSSPQSGQ